MYNFKQYFLRLICCFTLLASTSIYAQSIEQNTFTPFITYSPQWYLSGYAFKNGPIAANENILLAPLFQTPNQLLFSNLRLLDKSGTPWESNVALGYRCLNASHTAMIGLYGGVDHLKTTTGAAFNQINMGAEAWYQNWFLGGNIYHPYGQQEYSASNPQTFSFRQNGGYRNIGFTETTEHVLPGVDAEIGHTLVGGLTVYGGGYYFHDASTKTLSGPKARAEYIFYAEPNHKLLGLFDRVALEGLMTNDAVRGINYYGGLTVGISWGGNQANLNLKGTERHMIDPIRRDVDVITANHSQQVNLPANIRDVDTLAAFNQAISDDKADVIAIHGKIDGVNDASINRNVYITGNTYQFAQNNHPVTVQLSEGGELVGTAMNTDEKHGLLHIKGDQDDAITLRDLTLSVDKSAPMAIFHNSDDGSMGILNVERILTNGSLNISVSGEDNNAVIDHITDSIFNIDVGGTTSLADNGVVYHINPHSALSFSAENGAALTVGKISNNLVETQAAYSPGMLFRTLNGNMLIGSIDSNSISTNDGRSPGLAFIATSGTISVKNITENSTDTAVDSMFFSAESFGKLNIDRIANNDIKMAGDLANGDYPTIISGITLLSEENANINIGSISDNNILIDCTNLEDNILFGINMDADGGNISGKEMNGNQIILENSSDNSWGVGLRQWYSTKPNFINFDSITLNQIILTGDGGDGFSLFAMSPVDGITINSLAENIVTQASSYNISE